MVPKYPTLQREIPEKYRPIVAQAMLNLYLQGERIPTPNLEEIAYTLEQYDAFIRSDNANK